MATSPSQFVAEIVHPSLSEAESQLSSIVYDMSQQVQMAMANMLKMLSNSSGIMEEMERCKNSAFERKKSLEEEKKQFQKLFLLS